MSTNNKPPRTHFGDSDGLVNCDYCKRGAMSTAWREKYNLPKQKPAKRVRKPVKALFWDEQ